jgi:hypothetical protein
VTRAHWTERDRQRRLNAAAARSSAETATDSHDVDPCSTLATSDDSQPHPSAVTLRTALSACGQCGRDISARRAGIRYCCVGCRVAAHRGRS